jgi:hypothetical protein
MKLEIWPFVVPQSAKSMQFMIHLAICSCTISQIVHFSITLEQSNVISLSPTQKQRKLEIKLYKKKAKPSLR